MLHVDQVVRQFLKFLVALALMIGMMGGQFGQVERSVQVFYMTTLHCSD